VTSVDPRVLSQLAAHDNDVENVRQAIRAADKKTRYFDELVAEYQADADAHKARFNELSLQIRQAELDVADLRRQINTHQGRLNDIADTREYRALNDEIRYLERQVSDKEEATLVTMEEKEKSEAALAQAKSALEDKTGEADTSKQDLAKDIERAQSRLAAAERTRADFVETMPAQTLTFYERRAAKMNRPVVWLWEDHACGFCHHSLTPQRRLEVLKGKMLINCESCGRVIVASADADTPA